MRKFKFLIVALVLCLTLSGCKISSKRKVSVLSYPEEFITRRLVENQVEVVNLGDNITYQYQSFNDKRFADIENGDAIFLNSSILPYYRIYRDQFIRLNDKLKVFDTGVDNSIQLFRRYTMLFVDNKDVIVEGNYYNDSQIDKIDIYKNDPYFHLDPLAMLNLTDEIYTVLSNLYPDLDDTLKTNKQKLENELAILDAQYQKLRIPDKSIAFVSLTNSYGYFQKKFPVSIYPIVLSKYGVYPDAKQLAVIKDKIIESKVKYALIEDNVPLEIKTKYLELIKELNLTEIKFYNLNTLSSENSSNGKDYISIMYENLESLQQMQQQNGG